MGIGALLVLTLSPLFSHHIVPGADAALAGRSHLVVLCLVALHALFAPIHGLFHLLFLGGLLHAAGDRLRAALLARRSLAPLGEERPRNGDAFWIAGRTASVEPDRIRVVSGLPAPAFTIGWWRPCVYIARETAEHLTARQLAAVIAHEGAHLRRRDPLRLSVLRFLSCTLFWLPAFRRLAADVADEVEILADDDAAAVTHPLVLASAILQVARAFSHGSAPAAATGFHRADMIDRRVRRLLGQEPAPSSHLTRRSLLGASVALCLVLASGTVMAHPLTDGDPGGDTAHCMHHDAPVVHHLFCVFDRADHGNRDCPHEAH